MSDELMIPCEGSGFPAHDCGMCKMCGEFPDTIHGDAAEHERRDVLAMIDRGASGER